MILNAKSKPGDITIIVIRNNFDILNTEPIYQQIGSPQNYYDCEK